MRRDAVTRGLAALAVVWVASTAWTDDFYRVERVDGRAWIVNPDGGRQCVLGVGHVPYAARTAALLKSWGFNNLGGGGDSKFCGKGFSHTDFIGFDRVCYLPDADRFIRKANGGPMTAMPNMFHPEFAAFCDQLAAEHCAPLRNDRDLLGYFLDNELAWWGKGALDTGFFDTVRGLPEGHSARKALETFVGSRPVTCALKTAFLELAANRYFATTAGAIRRHDPNHLVLGCRFAGMEGAHDVVWKAAGRHCDVISFNIYPFVDFSRGVVRSELGGRSMSDVFAHYAEVAGRPILVSEWSFPALDTGRRCRCGAGQRLPTQKERAKAVELFVKTMLASPSVVGYDFFKWMDQPSAGQNAVNPEDCNYGLVSEGGEPYAELTKTFADLHARANELHQAEPPGARVRFAFAENGQDWTLANDAGLVVRGRLNGPMVNCIALKGENYGYYDSLVEVYNRHVWLSAVRTRDVRFVRKGLSGVVTIVAETNENDGRKCEVTHRLEVTPDGRNIQCEIVAVRNISTRRIRFVGVYACPRPFGPEAVAVNDPLTADHTPSAAAWRYPDGRTMVVRSEDAALGGVTFARDGNGYPHSDCRFVPSERIFLEPGETYFSPSSYRATVELQKNPTDWAQGDDREK